ncbi:MAG: EAL domain-containing protein [Polyangiaceae bacterium]
MVAPAPSFAFASSTEGVEPMRSAQPTSAHPVSGAHGISRARVRGSILVVDDDAIVRRSLGRALGAEGYEVVTCPDGHSAIAKLIERPVDVIISDIAMPGMDGIQLLREVRTHDLHVPVVLITGEPAVSTAVQALEYGAFHYLTKPVKPTELNRVIDRANRLHRMARVKEQAAELLGTAKGRAADRAGLEASLEGALATLWMAYQPIVSARTGAVYGHEALLRSEEPSLPHPGAVIDAAERLGELQRLGRIIRDRAAGPAAADPARAGILFVNLHVHDLLDPSLVDPDAPLSRIAERVVLEVTERSSLDEIKDVRNRVSALREMGYRIAVDDLGAGYAGLTSFAQLEPEVVKLDMSLVRDVHLSSTKQKVIRSMAGLCRDMGMLVVGEGVENAEERDALVILGCDLLQGYYFSKPARPFPPVRR